MAHNPKEARRVAAAYGQAINRILNTNYATLTLLVAEASVEVRGTASLWVAVGSRWVAGG